MSRPKCSFKDCNNRVMKSTSKNVLLDVCQGCFDKGRPWDLDTNNNVEDDGEETLYESSLGYL